MRQCRSPIPQVFDWLYPHRFPVVTRCLEAFVDIPAVTTSILKFLSELALNKSQRVTFDASSPNGILLFREVSKAVCLYGRHVLALGTPQNAYAQKYKGIGICLTMLMRALAGNYVNFGVFRLYSDPALTDALSMGLMMAQSIALSDILAYRKVSKAYCGFVEIILQNHTRVVAMQGDATFRFILESLDAGIKSLDVTISSHCASAIDNLVSHYLVSLQTDAVDINDSATPPEIVEIKRLLAENPQALPAILGTLLEYVLLEDVTNQWSLSRPLLPLIILNETSYQEIKEHIIRAQRPAGQAALRDAMNNLMDGVEPTLESKNRDKVTQNLAMLKHVMRSQKSVVPRVSVADMS